MAQTATTIEQSRKLLELGIDPETADMSIRTIVEPYMSEDVAWHSPILLAMPYSEAKDIYKGDEVLPAWSLAAIIAILPENIEVCDECEWYTVYPKIDKDGGRWWVGYGDIFGGANADLFAAIIDLIERLVKQGYIKTKK